MGSWRFSISNYSRKKEIINNKSVPYTLQHPVSAKDKRIVIEFCPMISFHTKLYSRMFDYYDSSAIEHYD